MVFLGIGTPRLNEKVGKQNRGWTSLKRNESSLSNMRVVVHLQILSWALLLVDKLTSFEKSIAATHSLHPELE